MTRPDERAAPAPDLVERLFDPDHVDHTWVGDVTYIPTDEGWLYLASTIDLASRHLIGWSMSDRHNAQLACDAPDAAVATRGRRRMDQVIMHTDRGSEEYTSTAFATTCRRLGARQSMGRTGSCLDKGKVERPFPQLREGFVTETQLEPPASIGQLNDRAAWTGVSMPSRTA